MIDLCFSIVNEVLTFYPIQFVGTSYCIDTEKITSFVLVRDLNESHIHPSTCSSALRTSSKSWGFRDISDWLSCVSNKLSNSWHVESYKEWAGLDRS